MTVVLRCGAGLVLLAAGLTLAAGCKSKRTFPGREDPRGARERPRGPDRDRLGRAPLCEPSAIVRAPWDRSVILVGDNEVDDALFAFGLRDRRLVGQRRLALPSGASVDDIEALAAVGSRVLVVGSHGRNKRCRSRPGRRRMVLLGWDATAGRLIRVGPRMASPAWDELVATPEVCLGRLFTSPAPVGAAALCRRLSQPPAKGSCRRVEFEGAATWRGRVWLGLRRPLMAQVGSGGRKAVLLRLAQPIRGLRFDAVRFADLGGRGVRALAAHGEALWGIGGPPQDSSARFGLWRWSAGGKGPVVETTDLPTSSEGLLLDFSRGRHALVVIDGEEGRRGRCEVPGRQRWLTLPAPLIDRP